MTLQVYPIFKILPMAVILPNNWKHTFEIDSEASYYSCHLYNSWIIHALDVVLNEFHMCASGQNETVISVLRGITRNKVWHTCPT